MSKPEKHSLYLYKPEASDDGCYEPNRAYAMVFPYKENPSHLEAALTDVEVCGRICEDMTQVLERLQAALQQAQPES